MVYSGPVHSPAENSGQVVGSRRTKHRAGLTRKANGHSTLNAHDLSQNVKAERLMHPLHCLHPSQASVTGSTIRDTPEGQSGILRRSVVCYLTGGGEAHCTVLDSPQSRPPPLTEYSTYPPNPSSLGLQKHIITQQVAQDRLARLRYSSREMS
ncbi:hypothetical protein BO82DRAFT_119558 [Aspergillus uvarum CBS 121591]|uniref:Uncharacterized protein n=1 Tax=Aspergillus uvarum CBS 121591 TaxID=1448315 RepID=A0A319C4D8_9EURO|nr:hypothetical protein BO82DRAFT_119558 [Aspergillus uvarum CBS 121591]PYH80014.1 hypothetical protein BO82DRAFT_119558 [Aspergillus uvarum CBS 121591]